MKKRIKEGSNQSDVWLENLKKEKVPREKNLNFFFCDS